MDGESAGRCRLVVSLLGPVDVYVNGVAAGISQPGLRILLAMLALSANQVVPVSALIDALWQEDASRQREKNLHVQVHLLRRRLAELEPERTSSRVVTAPPGYMLALADGELDAQSFAALARNGRQLVHCGDAADGADVLRQALHLWRGPALGESAQACARLGAEAAGLEEQRLAVLEDQADADLAAGRHADLAGQLPGLIAQFPLRERLRGQLMLALYRCGRQGDALAAYRQARELLGEELGLDPGPQLQALQHQILAADPHLDFSPVAVMPRPVSPANGNGAGPGGSRSERAAGAAAANGSGNGAAAIAQPADRSPAERRPERGSSVTPRQLPARVRHFAGRDSELRELNRVLDEATTTDAATVVVITGTAGVGKTALALHWAHEAASQFPDGQLHVNLRGYDPSGAPLTPAEAVRILLNGLGVAREQIPDTQEAQAGLYRSLMADRRMLIVLDNARDADQVRPLLPGGPKCLALVTSRSALSGLVAAVSAYPVQLGLLDERDAQALLAARLGAERTAAEPIAVAQIISLCSRLPLALAITAARAAAKTLMPLAALAAELASEQDRLDALDTGDEATSLRAVFSWSYGQLTDSAARMFRLLGSHPGPDVSVPATASLAGVTPPQARRALTELASASLLIEHAPARYILHDLLRAYAAEQDPDAATAQERSQAQARLVDHYLHTAHAGTLRLAPLGHPIVLDPALPGVIPEQLASHDGALAWFRTELHVLLAAVKLAERAGLDKPAWQLPWTLRSFLDGQGLWQDWAAVNQIALAAAERQQDHTGLGWTHHRMAQVCSLSGAIDDGITHNSLALAHFEIAGNAAGQGSAHLGMCIALGRKADHDSALFHGEQALGLFRSAGDRIGEAYMLHLVGLQLARTGSAEQGRDHCTQAVELYGELGDLGGMADAWHSLGTVHQQLGEYVEGIACFQQALMLSAELGDLWGQAYCLIHVGDTHDLAGDVLGARETWQQALEMLGDLQHPDADRIRTRLHETADLPDGADELDISALTG
jgi:DNA-binding SARP family transcriptional activator/tetratricopeptide (TPR) repeat protein